MIDLKGDREIAIRFYVGSDLACEGLTWRDHGLSLGLMLAYSRAEELKRRGMDLSSAYDKSFSYNAKLLISLFQFSEPEDKDIL